MVSPRQDRLGVAGRPKDATFGIGLTSPSPELAQIVANSGFDMVVIDMEHGPISIETAYRMVTAMRRTNTEVLIRVTHNDAATIKAALDTGANGIVVPMINTAQDAQDAMAAAMYPPRGIRGFGPFRTQYQRGTDMWSYAADANDEVKVVLLIEHPTGLQNLDEILAVEGIGGAWVVPLDLSVNMGFIDGPNHPEVLDALRTGAKKVMERGFPAGTFVVTPEQARHAYDLGFRQFFLGFDTMFVPAAVQLFLSQMQM